MNVIKSKFLIRQYVQQYWLGQEEEEEDLQKEEKKVLRVSISQRTQSSWSHCSEVHKHIYRWLFLTSFHDCTNFILCMTQRRKWTNFCESLSEEKNIFNHVEWIIIKEQCCSNILHDASGKTPTGLATHSNNRGLPWLSKCFSLSNGISAMEKYCLQCSWFLTFLMCCPVIPSSYSCIIMQLDRALAQIIS